MNQPVDSLFLRCSTDVYSMLGFLSARDADMYRQDTVEIRLRVSISVAQLLGCSPVHHVLTDASNVE